jgi:hypothetical protein
MHRHAVLSDVATRLQECMVDRADRYPACMIGLKRIGNIEQLRQRDLRIGGRYRVAMARDLRRVR